MSESLIQPRGVRRAAIGLLLGALLGLGACASNGKDDQEDYVEEPVDELYNRAMNLMQQGDDRQAARAFDDMVTPMLVGMFGSSPASARRRSRP